MGTDTRPGEQQKYKKMIQDLKAEHENEVFKVKREAAEEQSNALERVSGGVA